MLLLANYAQNYAGIIDASFIREEGEPTVSMIYWGRGSSNVSKFGLPNLLKQNFSSDSH